MPSQSPGDSHRPPSHRFSDLDRPPLAAAALRRAVVGDGEGLWRELTVTESTGSTNNDLAERARTDPKADGVVLVAERQSAARGRLDRRWEAPARSGIFLSVLLRPTGVPAERLGWLPLLAGVATATALSRTAGVDTALKWPNDLLVEVDGEERKTGGILAERPTPDAVVLGIGLNVTLRAEELPVPTATSLALAGASCTDRDPLLRAVLRSLAQWYGQWRDAGGDPDAGRLRGAYAVGCATLGREVRAQLPGDRDLVGRAVGVDERGRLLIATDAGREEAVAAGDVIHLRPA
jgi:BirA family biotin operon repressor/biotin-[acetyl-CoA-carboxylase] ligase